MERFKNQALLLDQEKLASLKFLVVGAGAIGSFYVSTLSKMGAKNITVIDDDTLEDHNIANQLYPIHLVGQSKVTALKDVASKYGDCLITPINARWHPDTAPAMGLFDVVVSAVDNMDVRSALYSYYSAYPEVKFFLDGRMAAQVYKVYGVDMGNNLAKEFYKTTLYSQAEAEPERCGQKSIIYTVLQVSGQMLSQTKRWIMNEHRPTEVVYDCLWDEVFKKYHMVLKEDVVELEIPEEVGVA